MQKIWSEDNRKISITIKICITIVFPTKKFLQESQNGNQINSIKNAVFKTDVQSM